MNAQFLVDLLENILVKKVKYIPHSMGIDHLLVPYIEPGVVELVETSPEAYLPIPFFINGGLESAAWRIDLDTKPSTYPVGNDLKNVMKVTLHDRSASLIFKIPTDYQINSELYPYLKFKIYAQDKSFFPGVYDNFRAFWPRFMNRIWGYPSESLFGQELWQLDKTALKLKDDQLEKWVDMVVDISPMKGKHNRVIVINNGGEPAITGGYKPAKDIIYHFANFRLSKEK